MSCVGGDIDQWDKKAIYYIANCSGLVDGYCLVNTNYQWFRRTFITSGLSTGVTYLWIRISNLAFAQASFS
jgi:hypothetical protein